MEKSIPYKEMHEAKGKVYMRLLSGSQVQHHGNFSLLRIMLEQIFLNPENTINANQLKLDLEWRYLLRNS